MEACARIRNFEIVQTTSKEETIRRNSASGLTNDGTQDGNVLKTYHYDCKITLPKGDFYSYENSRMSGATISEFLHRYIEPRKDDGTMNEEKLFDILREDRLESEKRIEGQIEKMENRLSQQNIESERRVNAAVDEIKNSFNRFATTQENTNKWIIGAAISLILGIAAMVITAVSAISAMVK